MHWKFTFQETPINSPPCSSDIKMVQKRVGQAQQICQVVVKKVKIKEEMELFKVVYS